jgi:single-strand selective monofunctional uracil DNA glycosylase
LQPSGRRGAVLEELVVVYDRLRDRADALTFGPPVAFVYDPLRYAWAPFVDYLRKFARPRPEVVLLGMNPGPFGMAQTGVPFGDVGLVRDWMGIRGTIGRPPLEHPKRRIQGFECTRSEVSGSRLCGWARDRFEHPSRFFERFLVLNYCPLVFLEASGRNRTPDRLPRHELEPLIDACDEALSAAVRELRPGLVVGVGAWATKQATRALADTEVAIGTVLHPSPASPRANRGWVDQAEADLTALGVDVTKRARRGARRARRVARD